MGIVCLDVVVDCGAHLRGRGKAGAPQGITAELGKPDFDLVEPGGVSGCVVEFYVLVPLQPSVVFGFMGVEVV